MFECALCERETCYITKLCPDCRKIKHLMTVASRERVVEILENVLSRTHDKQNNKIKEEVKKEVEQITSHYDLIKTKPQKK